jgi:hypothetical protein
VKVIVIGHTKEPTNFSVKTEYDLTTPQELVREKISQGNRLVVGLLVTFTEEPMLHLQVVTQETQTDYVLEDKETQTNF